MTTKHSLIVILLLLIGATSQAQNHLYDWGIGIHPSIYSFSAVRNKTYSSPYEYNLGIGYSFSRYINNNFDLGLEIGQSKLLSYPTTFYDSPVRNWEYERMRFYDAQFTLKYKLNNGYVIREDFVAAPFLKVGFGANKADVIQSPEYFIPGGLGVSVQMGKFMSFSYQSNFKYALQTPKSYMSHSLGLTVHFGKASRKRILAMRDRERSRRAELIAKYRKKKAEERAKLAKERLARIKDKPTEEKEQKITLVQASEEPAAPVVMLPELDEPEEERKADGDESDREKIIVRPGMARARLITKHESLPPMPKVKPRVQIGETTKEEEKIVTVDPKEVPPGRLGKQETTQPVVKQPIEKLVETKQSVTESAPVTEPIVEKPVETVVVNEPVNEEPVTEEPVKTEEQPTEIVIASNPVYNTPETEETLPVDVPEIPQIKETTAFCKTSDQKLTNIGRSINFESNSYRIRSRMMKHLTEVLDIMETCSDVSYVIVAHTDSDGDPKYNRKLSRKRAQAVKKVLIESGIPASRLITAAFGEALQVEGASKEENRRVSFKINHSIEKELSSN